jgi:transcriptional antiterminator NusG
MLTRFDDDNLDDPKDKKPAKGARSGKGKKVRNPDDFDADYDDPVYESAPSGKPLPAWASKPDSTPKPSAEVDEFPGLLTQTTSKVARKFTAGEINGEKVEITVDDTDQWYIVHCYSGYENKVQNAIRQRITTMGMQDNIFDVLVPTQDELEIKEGKRRTVERKIFPGYILVKMKMNEDSWSVVRNTPGVSGFVGMGNEPTPLRPEEFNQIIRRTEADATRINIAFKIGDKVRIIDGPFNDFPAIVDQIDMERAKVRVMVSFFGRDTPVDLDFLQVEKQ